MKINISQTKLDELNERYMVGVLANSIDSLPSIGYEHEPITIMKNSNNNVVFHIKPLSEESDYVKDNINPHVPYNTYIGIDSHNKNFFDPEFFYENNSEKKIEKAKKLLENKIIIFKPHISVRDEKIHKNVEIIKVIDGTVSRTSLYMTIQNVLLEKNEFEQKISVGKEVIIKDFEKRPLKQYVICENCIYGVFDSWERFYTTKDAWICTGENIRKTDLNFDSDEFKENTIKLNEEVFFMTKDYLQVLDARLFDGDTLMQLEEDGPKVEVEIDTEAEFLKRFKETTMKRNLYYKEKDLVNFHISLKTSPITIVAGMTGTGKTQIAKCYAEALGLSQEDGSLLFLPISPSYTEPQDVLGYLNPTTGLYTNSETGLVDILIRATSNPDKMYMVLFDEMNLSQIEYWFAPFLSLLELPPKDRILSLYGQDQTCHNKYQYSSSIVIPQNILFVGTVNLDETTKDFSDRVMDRANVIELEKENFETLFKIERFESLANNDEDENSNLAVSYSDFGEWRKPSNGLHSFKIEELKFLDMVHSNLTMQSSQKGISFRLVEHMGAYLNNIPRKIDGEMLMSREEAFDYIIKQKVLVKLRGSERELAGIIEVNYDVKEKNSPLLELFESDVAQDISDFTLVKQQIKNKEKDLNKYGYTN